MRGWKRKKDGGKSKPQAVPAVRQDTDAAMFEQIRNEGLAAAAAWEEKRRAAARRARRDAARRARRLVASWAKATAGWTPAAASVDLEVRVSRAIRSATERGAP